MFASEGGCPQVSTGRAGEGRRAAEARLQVDGKGEAEFHRPREERSG